MTRTHPLLVESARLEATEVVSLRLVDPEGRRLPAWSPGAHIDFVLPSGLVRQYSLCGDPADADSYTIAVLREPAGRGGSIEIHDPALVGKTVGVSEPRNLFPLVSAKRYLFIAGGIGITPILPMIRSVIGMDVPWRLIYGGRTHDSMAFVDTIKSLGANCAELFPQDKTGMLAIDDILRDAQPGTAVYCCGPEGLISAVEQSSQHLLPASAIHVERFTAPKQSPLARREGGTGFEVELRRSGIVLHVPPDRSMLDAIRDEIPTVESSCEDGFCGACAVGLLEGTPEHNDTVLTAAERACNNQMMICVGRAKSDRIVLDL